MRYILRAMLGCLLVFWSGILSPSLVGLIPGALGGGILGWIAAEADHDR